MTASPPVPATADQSAPPPGAGWSSNFALSLAATAVRRPGDTAIVAGDESLTFQELAEHAGGVSRLVRRRTGPGGRVAIVLPSRPAAAAAFYGVLAAGAVAVNVNERLRSLQIDHIVRHSGASLVLTSERVAARLPGTAGSAVPLVRVEDIPRGDSYEPVVRVGADLALLAYTPAGTGLATGVAVSHANLWAGTESVVGYLGLTHDDRIAGLLPFSFDYGLSQLLCTVRVAATLVVDRSPAPARVAATLRRAEVTVVSAVPHQWLKLLETAPFRDPIASVRILANSGGRLPVEAARALRRAQPQADLFLMYGLPEAFRSTFLAPALVAEKPGSVGRAIPGAEVLVVDEHGAECPVNSVGEILHRGPTVAVGYWDDEDATAWRFRANPVRETGVPATERVVYSGDLGYRDEDGDIYVVGRRDSLIRTRGRRVSRDEVADALYASGEVVGVLVGAEADDRFGARIVAYVVLGRGGDVDRLAAFGRRELPHYMQPARYEVRAALPRTVGGTFDPGAAGTGRDGEK